MPAPPSRAQQEARKPSGGAPLGAGGQGSQSRSPSMAKKEAESKKAAETKKAEEAKIRTDRQPRTAQIGVQRVGAAPQPISGFRTSEQAQRERSEVAAQIEKGKALGLNAGWGEIFSDKNRFKVSGGLKTVVGSPRGKGSLGLGGLPTSMLGQLNRLALDPNRPNPDKPIEISSAHRSEAYNRDVYARLGQPPTKSQHTTELSGRFGAVDLTGVAERDKPAMIAAAKRAGFQRVGTYPGSRSDMLHLDMKRSPTGGYGPASPEVAAAKLANVPPTNAPRELFSPVKDPVTGKTVAYHYQEKPRSLSERKPSTLVASSSPFAASAAQAAAPALAPVKPSVVKPMPKPADAAKKAAEVARAKEVRKVAAASLRANPFENVSARVASAVKVAQAKPRKMQDRLPEGTGRMTTPKDQSRLPEGTGRTTVPKMQDRIPPGSGEFSSPPVRSRSPGPPAAPKADYGVPVANAPAKRSVLPSVAAVKTAAPKVAPYTRSRSPAVVAAKPPVKVQGVRPSVIGRNVFTNVAMPKKAAAPAPNQYGLSPSALPSVIKAALPTLSKMKDFKLPNVLGNVNKAASYVKMFADAQPGLGITRTAAKYAVMNETKKAMASAQKAISDFQKGTLSAVEAAKKLQQTKTASVQPKAPQVAAVSGVKRAPHGLISNELRAKIAAKESASAPVVASTPARTQPKTTSLQAQMDAADPNAAPKRDIYASKAKPRFGQGGQGGQQPLRKSSSPFSTATLSQNPFLFPAYGPSFPADLGAPRPT